MTRPYPASELFRTPVKCATSLMRELATPGRTSATSISTMSNVQRIFMELERQNVFENSEQKGRLVRIGQDSFSIKIHFHIGNCGRQDDICRGKVILPDGPSNGKKLVFLVDCHLFRAL